MADDDDREVVDIDPIINNWLDTTPPGRRVCRGEMLSFLLICNGGSLDVPSLGKKVTRDGPSGHPKGLSDEQVIIFAHMSGVLQGWNMLGFDPMFYVRPHLERYLNKHGLKWREASVGPTSVN